MSQMGTDTLSDTLSKLPNQTEATVQGVHYVQQTGPDGETTATFVRDLRSALKA